MTQYLALILALIGACKLIAAPPLFMVTNAMGVEEQGNDYFLEFGCKACFSAFDGFQG